MSSLCCFCSKLVLANSSEPWDKVLRDTGNFIIAPSKGSLVPGWLMVIAKAHALCTGAIPPSHLQELEEALQAAKHMATSSFGEPTLFEHGPAFAGTPVGCGIDHQHIHVVPLTFSLKEATSHIFPEVKWEPLSGLSESSKLHESGTPYCFVQEPRRELFWCRPPYGVRQLFRRAIAEKLGIPDQFDYARFPQPSNAAATIQYLSPVRS